MDSGEPAGIRYSANYFDAANAAVLARATTRTAHLPTLQTSAVLDILESAFSQSTPFLACDCPGFDAGEYGCSESEARPSLVAAPLSYQFECGGWRF